MAGLPSTAVVYLSVREPPLDPPRTTKFQYRGLVAEFLAIGGDGKGKVRYEDGTEDEIDSCILTTGYGMDIPFLPDSLLQKSLPPTQIPPIPKDKLYNSTYHIFPLPKYLFPATEKYPPTSLAFPGLLFRVSPLPLVEAQAHAMVKLWTSPELLDVDSEIDAVTSRYEMLKDRYEGDEFQAAKRYFSFDPPEQFQYRDGLYTLAYRGDEEKLKSYLSPAWHKKMYLYAAILRAEWEEMGKTGEAEDFVKGVGEVSSDEWEGDAQTVVKSVGEERDIRDWRMIVKLDTVAH